MLLRYPLKIIPRFYYRWFDVNLLASGNYFLIRRSASTKIPFDRMGTLSPSQFAESKKDLEGLSMNLLGAFKKEYIVYRATKYSMKPWSEGKLINLFKVLKNVAKHPGFHPVIIPIQTLHGQQIPYLRSDPEYLKKIPASMRNQEPSVVLQVDHEPNNSNFWHVQLAVKDSRTGQKVKFSAKYSDSIYHNFVSNILSTVLKPKECISDRIPKSVFFQAKNLEVLKKLNLRYRE